MRNILAVHAARYPSWAVDDLYKLIHQAALGSEHAVSDEAHARDRFIRELAGLGPGPAEPLVDPITPSGDIVRVHLRPFAGLAVPEERLLEGIIRTAREHQGRATELGLYGEAAGELAREGGLEFRADEIAGYFARLREAGYPAVHHSAGFEAEYRPAYRVLARRFVPAGILSAA